MLNYTVPMQLKLFPWKSDSAFGGEKLKGRRKSARPLSTKHAIHLNLRADCRRLRRNERRIINTIHRFANLFGVRIYALSINSNHIHAWIRIYSRSMYRAFIQALTGTLAKSFGFKWALRPYTRIVTWGKAYTQAKMYIHMNEREASGEIPYQPRGRGSSKSRTFT